MRHLFFLAQCMLSHLSLIPFFVCQTYAVILFKICLSETAKYSFQDTVQLGVILFAAEFIVFVIVCLSFFWFYCLETPLWIQFLWLLKKSRWTLLAPLNSSIIFSYSFLSFSTNMSWVGVHCFGAPTFLSLTFVDDGKYVISYNLHAMGGVCKEGWIWGFLIKFSFRWIQNLSSGTFGWMLEHTLHGAVIIFDDVINDKKAII